MKTWSKKKKKKKKKKKNTKDVDFKIIFRGTAILNI